MDAIDLDDVTLHVRQDGRPGGPPVVFANSLGTDLRLWDEGGVAPARRLASGALRQAGTWVVDRTARALRDGGR